MKNFSFILFIFVLLISCKNEIVQQTPIKTDGFNIIGNIKQFENKTIFLQKQGLDKTYKTIDKTNVNGDSFFFSGKVTEPELMYLGFGNSDHKIPLIANNFETYVNIKVADLDKTKIIGSTIQTDYTNYLNGLVSAKNKFVYQLDFIKTNSNSLLSAIVLEQILGKTKWRLDQNKKAFNTLSNDIKITKLGEFINTFINENEPLVKDEVAVEELSLNPEVANEIPKIQEVIKEAPVIKIIPAKKIPKRRKAPNFYAESQNGTDISLNQVKKNAKVTLIDFWASWCGPCRKSNPHLIQLYNKYHSKGFNIIGVSEDKYVDINKWKNAIAVDGLPWQQVIDDNSRVANMFKVRSVPHTVLLDQNGGIIFVKKSTYTIEQKLKEIFGF